LIPFADYHPLVEYLKFSSPWWQARPFDSLLGGVYPEILDARRCKSYKIEGGKVTKP
jgi:hypothetical protein